MKEITWIKGRECLRIWQTGKKKEESVTQGGGGGDVHVPRSHIDKINVTSSASYIVWTKSSSKIKRVNETFKAWSDF